MTMSRGRMIALIGIALILAIQGAVLYFFGQPPICTCGYVKVWEGVVLSPGNSQHLSDWYTFSHIVHGLIFYGLLTLLLPRMPVSRRVLIALGVEVAWEITENTPMVIEHYRQQALAVGYTGDSVINSVMDSVFMLFGFLFAWRFPWTASLALALALEVFALVMIRDNLTLNVINLIHVFPAIASWQAAGGIH